jgi:DNA-binding response OmpR family regulator
MKYNVYFVEDDENVNQLIEATLLSGGFNAFGFLDPELFLEVIKDSRPDLIVLDLMLPKISGFDVLKILKDTPAYADIPVIILSALSSENDIVKGLDMGANDYITKPFNPKVLVAKVNNLMMRMDKENSLKMEYKIGELSFDFINSSVTFEGKPLELTKTEFKMLAFLAKNNNKVCSRELLLDEVWGLEVYVDDRIVDAYIKKLRKIIAPKKYIKTVFGTGYRFSIEEK